METQTISSEKQMTAIERALAAAKARKAAKGETSEASAEAKPAKTPKPKGEAATDESRAAAKAQRDADRAARAAAKAGEAEAKAAAKAQREADRAAKKAAKAAAAAQGKTPAHMKKVEKARAKCPPMAEATTRIYDEAATNLSALQMEALAAHLVVQARAVRTQLAASSPIIALGTTVQITGGDPKFIGSTGKVVASNKLRLKVAVDGVKAPVYLYVGEAAPVTATAAA